MVVYPPVVIEVGFEFMVQPMAFGIAADRNAVYDLGSFIVIVELAQEHIGQGITSIRGVSARAVEPHRPLYVSPELFILPVVLVEEARLQGVIAPQPGQVVLNIDDRVGVQPWMIGS